MSSSLLKLYPLLLVLAAILSVFSGFDLHSSFWLDETLTGWIISGSLFEVGARVQGYQPMSPLYFWFIWGFKQIFGESELILRMPSLCAGIGSLALVYRFATEKLSRIPALLSVVLLATNGDFVSMAVSTRPYALALFFSLLAVRDCFLWSENNQSAFIARACFFHSVAFYLHYLAGITTVPVMLLAYLRYCRNYSSLSRSFGAVLGIWGAGLIPGVFHIFELSGRSGRYSYAPPVSLMRILNAIIPADVGSILVVSLLVALVVIPLVNSKIKPEALSLLLVFVAWMALPSLTLVAISLVLSDSVLVGRYHLIGFAGAAMASGALVALVEEKKFHLSVLTIVSLLIVFSPRSWRLENWREAILQSSRGENGDKKGTLLYTGLIEAESPEWIMEKKNHDYLLSPVIVYGDRKRALPVSARWNDAYMNQVVQPMIQRTDNINLIVSRSPDHVAETHGTSVFDVYRQFLSGNGFEEISFQNFGLVSLSQFARSGGSAQASN